MDGRELRVEVTPHQTIADVNRSIETAVGYTFFGRLACPAAQQTLFHRGKGITDDGSTLEDNNITEQSSVVVALNRDILKAKLFDTPEARLPPIVLATESTGQQPLHTQSTETTPATPTENPVLQGYRDIPEDSQLKKFEILASSKNQREVFVASRIMLETLRAAAEANPPLSPAVLHGFGQQDTELRSLIQDHEADFFLFITGTVQGGEGSVQDQQVSLIPEAFQLTPEENEAIGRLEALGLNRADALRAYFACNKNEELAAKYLVEHAMEDDA